MEDFKYFKDGEVFKCTTLESIVNSELISDRVKKECKSKFNKKCYFRFGTSTKIGTLKGIEINGKLSSIFYILENSGEKFHIPCEESITLL